MDNRGLPRYQRLYTVVSVIFALSCVGIGAYVLATGGPLPRGLGGLAALLCLLIGPICRRLFRLQKALLVDACLLVFILLAFTLGVALGLYSYIWWYDLAAHLLSGAVAAQLGLYLYWMLREDKTAPMARDATAASGFAFFFAQFIAIVWEMFEFVSDKLTGNDSQCVAATGVNDTMEDMMIAMAGSVVMAVLMWLHLRGKHRSWTMKPADEFFRANYGKET